jgi:hypothetical protein
VRSTREEAIRRLGDEELAAAAGGATKGEDVAAPAPIRAPDGPVPSLPRLPALDILGEIIPGFPRPPVIYY